MPSPLDRSDTDDVVLVVDDEPLVRRSLKRILGRQGFSCPEAESVEEGIEILERRDDIPLVLIDIRMPGRSGLELVDYVSERSPEVVAVTVTAIDDTSIAADALSRGAYAYVVKPFDATEIEIQVESALRHRELELAHRDRRNELEELVRRKTEMLRRSREELVLRLVAASQHRDIETGEHIRRTGLYSATLAELMGWDADRCDDLCVAAPMHDIGKLGIPDEILLKPGELEEEEWEVMKRHTEIGADILENPTTDLLKMARRITLQHHEKWNGEGYPQGLGGEEIAPEARIVAVVDVYDALTHERVYREAWSEEEALEHIEDEKGEHFDPEIADLFLENLDRLHEVEQQSDQLEFDDADWPSGI